MKCLVTMFILCEGRTFSMLNNIFFSFQLVYDKLRKNHNKNKKDGEELENSKREHRRQILPQDKFLKKCPCNKIDLDSLDVKGYFILQNILQSCG